jgi:diacylglycerol kinase (ATP)
MTFKKVVVILNPCSGSGKGEKLFGVISKRLEVISEKEGIEAVVKKTDKYGSKMDASNLAQEALSGGCSDIIFCGGDGIFNEGINGIMKTVGLSSQNSYLDNVSIGFIPAGTGNNLAKNLGIPLDSEGALYTAIHGVPKEVDLLKVNDRFVANVVSFGLDAVITEKSLEGRFLSRKYRYVSAALKEIFDGIASSRMPSYQIELNGDGINYSGKVTLVAIANGPTYGGIFKIAPGAEMTDGKADICLIEEMGPIKALRNVYRLTRGTHLKLKEVKIFKASSFSVISRDVLPCEIDGEVEKPQKVYFISTVPKKIKIRLPNIGSGI